MDASPLRLSNIKLTKIACLPQPQPDTSKMTPEEKAHFDKFGMLPKKSLATHMLGKRDEVISLSLQSRYFPPPHAYHSPFW